MPNNRCPLCHASSIHPFHQDNRRYYFQCTRCQLVFADRTTLLSDTEELAQYQLHENNLEDPGYRQFLQRLAAPLLSSLPAAGLSGLDFGCGPGPLLAQMLREAGLRVESDLRGEKINYKIREHSLQKMPYLLVAGEREMQAGHLAVRTRSGEDLGSMPIDALIERLKAEIESKV